MSSSAFRVKYYRERLAVYERVDLAQCPQAELLALAGEASSLYKFLTDIIEEGYAATVQKLTAQTDALNRLQRFLSDALDVLGPPSEHERFYLMPDPVVLETLPTGDPAFTSRAELTTYLHELDERANCPPDLDPWFSDAGHRQRWQTKTQRIMTEMFEFLKWICARLIRAPHLAPVTLLRDTLLIHLALTWLRREGLPVAAPAPIMMGRTFADTCGNGRQIHGVLSDVVHQILLEHPDCDVETMRRQFAHHVRQGLTIPAQFTQASQGYLDALALDGSPLLIESGVQGTFPLWLLALMDNVGDMVLYTTLPWLLSTYRPIVFQPNYNYLRDMETLVAHDHLFQFSDLDDGQVWVGETTHELVRALALYEIALFKDLVRRRQSEIMRAAN